jgi:hypothetical protein
MMSTFTPKVTTFIPACATSQINWRCEPAPERDMYRVYDEHDNLIDTLTLDEASAYLEWYGRDSRN